MVSEILRAVSDSESEAELIIQQAKEEAHMIRSQAKDDIAEARFTKLTSFGNDADKRREAVREEEERKDKEFELKIREELEVLAKGVSDKEDMIIEQLSKRIYAL